MALGRSNITVNGPAPSATNKHKRDKKVRLLGKSRSSFSSEEELTGGGGIQVQRTVEIMRHTEKDEDGGSSTESGSPTLWS
jgi:hypothetical protein